MLKLLGQTEVKSFDSSRLMQCEAQTKKAGAAMSIIKPLDRRSPYVCTAVMAYTNLCANYPASIGYKPYKAYPCCVVQ